MTPARTVSAGVKLAYFVHDLNDPAVQRRVRMFQAGGASVTLIGFWRGEPPCLVEGIAPLLLGRTEDGRLLKRGAAVLRGLFAAPRWRKLLVGVDAIIARQLETLGLAVIAGRLHAPSAPVVFECLDIHGLLGTAGFAGWLLRAAERRLLPRCQAVMISSPAFVSAHFARAHASLAPVIIVENKVLSFEFNDPAAPSRLRSGGRAVGPPWRIGWYGVLRCARSLRLLADLAVAMPGVVEIVMCGRVATHLIPDFHAVVAATPGLFFGGAYDRRHDLVRLYGDVHFAWAVDFYEAGGNSDWLLPNRLYEAGLFGAVPIALAEVATGAWLARRDVGVLLHGKSAVALREFFLQVDRAVYTDLVRALAKCPETDFIYTVADCEYLVRRITTVVA